jgi:hypothetical protein
LSSGIGFESSSARRAKRLRSGRVATVFAECAAEYVHWREWLGFSWAAGDGTLLVRFSFGPFGFVGFRVHFRCSLGDGRPNPP